jgi:hypothetical protein
MRALLVGPGAALLVLALYNWARFEGITRTGYDPSVDNFSTPLLVGLYGQLASSGKSLFLYAPLAFAALWGWRALVRRHRAEAGFAIAVLVLNLVLHAKFASWAGEGSWGPRYLVPFLPWFLLPAAELVESGRSWARRAVLAALVLGVAVQIGGSAIYFGSYMRDLGEYPYTRSFTDPLFMHRSHFVPNYSPVVGHWRLLIRNVGVLWSDSRPDLAPRADVDGRLPLADDDREKLRFVVDYWFCYGIYAGLPVGLMVALAILAAAMTGAAALALRRALPPPVP